MKKRIILLCMVLLFLSACSTENTGKDAPTPTEEAVKIVTPTNTPRPTLTSTAKQLEDVYLNTLDKIDWTELEYYVNEEDSRRNSNLLNSGWLTYDANGNIYYANQRDNNIYTCDYKGENIRLMFENTSTNYPSQIRSLQVNGEWLYFRNEERFIDRIHIETGEIETVYPKICGEFVIGKDKIVVDGREELCVIDLDGSNKQVISWPEQVNLYNITVCGDFWLCNALGNYETYNQTYLVKCDGEKMEVLNQRGGCPLLAGHYLSVNDPETNLRHIWNLETKEDVDLNAWTNQSVVSDGKYFYYKETKVFDSTLEEGERWPSMDTCIYRWDGETIEKLWMIESDNLYEMFLTPTALYCTPQMKIDGKYGYHLLYYILETGETGVIY